jgi:hypothetical protein
MKNAGCTPAIEILIWGAIWISRSQLQSTSVRMILNSILQRYVTTSVRYIRGSVKIRFKQWVSKHFLAFYYHTGWNFKVLSTILLYKCLWLSQNERISRTMLKHVDGARRFLKSKQKNCRAAYKTCYE